MEVKEWTYREFPEFEEKVENAIILETTGDEIGVSYIRDVEYVTVDEHVLHLQMLLPYSRNRIVNYCETEMKGYPCVVFVQGSAWMEQNVYADLPMISKLAEKGYVVAIVEYRHSGIAAFPAQIHDTRNAIRYLKCNAEKYGIDAEKMIVAGDSSGGHVAVFSGIMCDDEKNSNKYPGISASVRGIIDLFGSVSVMLEDGNPMTVNHLLPDSPEGRVMGGVNLREHFELRQKLSAECNIDETTAIAPVLIMHGTKDRIVNTKQSVILYEKLKSCGKEAELVFIQGADHGGPEFWTDKSIGVMDRFIRKCVE